jgi:hypothetical protein
MMYIPQCNLGPKTKENLSWRKFGNRIKRLGGNAIGVTFSLNLSHW